MNKVMAKLKINIRTKNNNARLLDISEKIEACVYTIILT